MGKIKLYPNENCSICLTKKNKNIDYKLDPNPNCPTCRMGITIPGNTILVSRLKHFVDYYKLDIQNILDMGANIGIWSILLSKKFEKSNIYAFEPIKKTYDLLQKNIDLNNVKNVKIYNYGIYSAEGTYIL